MSLTNLLSEDDPEKLKNHISLLEEEISQHKHYREQAEQNERRLNKAQTIAHIGSWELDLLSNTLTWSDEVYRIFDMEPNAIQVTYEDFLLLIHPNDKERVSQAYLDSLHNKEPYTVTHRILTQEGAVKYVNAQCETSYDATKKPIISRGTIHDITEQMILEKHMVRTEKMEAISRLASGVAHDFNNILGEMLGFAELSLTMLEEPHKITKNMNAILRSGDRATQLIRQILSFSKNHSETKKAIKIKPIIQDAISLLSSGLPKTVDLKTYLEEEDSSIYGNAMKIHEAIIHICTNAASAMKNNGTLSISYSSKETQCEQEGHIGTIQPGTYAIIKITDTGCGMSENTINHIFDPFFTTKGMGHGSGMGMAIVFGILQDHGADITITSKVWNGTVFQMYIPQISTHIHTRKHTHTHKHIQRGTESILFVDDETSLNQVMTALIKSLGYTVTSFTNPQDALNAFRKTPDVFDLVITDYTMPKITGIDLSKKMLSINPSLPIILCTGYSQDANRQNVLDAGIKEFLMKPVSLKSLASTIRLTLDSQTKK